MWPVIVHIEMVSCFLGGIREKRNPRLGKRNEGSFEASHVEHSEQLNRVMVCVLMGFSV